LEFSEAQELAFLEAVWRIQDYSSMEVVMPAGSDYLERLAEKD